MKYILILMMFSVSVFAGDFDDYKKHSFTEKEFEMMSDALKGKLKDPDSLRFSIKDFKKIKAMSANNGGNIIGCAEFNAKNSYGGYGNPSVVVFIMMTNPKIIALLPMIPPVDVSIIPVEQVYGYPHCTEAIKKWEAQ